MYMMMMMDKQTSGMRRILSYNKSPQRHAIEMYASAVIAVTHLYTWPWPLTSDLENFLSNSHSSSSSSTRGRGGLSVRSPHGAILGAVEGVSSGQTTVWTNLVKPGDGRTAPWSAPVNSHSHDEHSWQVSSKSLH